MTDQITKKDREALGLPKDTPLTLAEVLHAVALGLGIAVAAILVVAGIAIWAVTL